MWYLFVNERINRMLKIIHLFHFFQFLEKYLNVLNIQWNELIFYWKWFNIFKSLNSFIELILNSFFIENDLISSSQSGFKQEDCCINQLLSITHIFEYLDQGYEVRGAFLDIWKAFEKVWHNGLIHKLEQKVYNIPSSFNF